MTCTGSCRVSNKANDSAWVVEESYFNSALSLADKGESGTHPSPPSTEMGLCVPLLSYLPLGSSHWPTLSQGFSWWQEQGTAGWGLKGTSPSRVWMVQWELVSCRACFCPGPCDGALSPLPTFFVSSGSLPAGEHSFPFQFLLPGESLARPGGGSW